VQIPSNFAANPFILHLLSCAPSACLPARFSFALSTLCETHTQPNKMKTTLSTLLPPNTLLIAFLFCRRKLRALLENGQGCDVHKEKMSTAHPK
jgi:hypothetical protein